MPLGQTALEPNINWVRLHLSRTHSGRSSGSFKRYLSQYPSEVMNDTQKNTELALSRKRIQSVSYNCIPCVWITPWLLKRSKFVILLSVDLAHVYFVDNRLMSNFLFVFEEWCSKTEIQSHHSVHIHGAYNGNQVLIKQLLQVFGNVSYQNRFNISILKLI